jgi:prepilin peptidase CpaA
MSAILFATTVILGVAVWFDIATRTIPDACAVGLCAVGLVARLLDGPMAALASIGVALVVGAFLVLLHARGVLGGGDVKLIAALLVGTAPAAAFELVFWIAMAGGMLGVAYLLLSFVMPRPALRPRAPVAVRVAVVEANRIARRGPLPYGVAIAAGAIAVGLGADVV